MEANRLAEVLNSRDQEVVDIIYRLSNLPHGLERVAIDRSAEKIYWFTRGGTQILRFKPDPLSHELIVKTSPYTDSLLDNVLNYDLG